MLIEVTAEQADLFKSAGVRIRYAVFAKDIVSVEVENVPVPVPAKRKRAYTHKFKRGTLVRLVNGFDAKMPRALATAHKTREYAEAIALVLHDKKAPMVRSELAKAVSGLLGKPYRGRGDCVNPMITDLLRRKLLVVA